jgi:radical SAM protein (TIGR01212 family)
VIYKELAPYLREKYGERVQRVSIAHFKTCPNRDGTVGKGGCTFCEETGSGFANHFRELSVRAQMIEGMKSASKKYKAGKFIAYFQSFTNTYGSIEELKSIYEEAIVEGVVALDISTRPDAFSIEIGELLKEIAIEKKIDVFVEFGLESVNENTLVSINRGHSVAEFVDATLNAKKYGFEIVAHVILDLPGDTVNDEIACAKLLSALGVNGVKMHSLYIAPNTMMAKLYTEGKIKPYDADEYVRRATLFLMYLDPKITIHRIVSTPPGNVLWSIGLSSAEVKKLVEEALTKTNKVQGSEFNYLNGASWRKNFSEGRNVHGIRSNG